MDPCALTLRVGTPRLGAFTGNQHPCKPRYEAQHATQAVQQGNTVVRAVDLFGSGAFTSNQEAWRTKPIQRDRTGRRHLDSSTSQHFSTGRPPAHGVVNTPSRGTNPVGNSTWTIGWRFLLQFCLQSDVKCVDPDGPPSGPRDNDLAEHPVGRGSGQGLEPAGDFCVAIPNLPGLGSPCQVHGLIDSRSVNGSNMRSS